MFQMSGIQFLWVRVFVEIWGLNKNHVTIAFLVVTAMGGGIGLGLGPRYIDRRGGFGTPPGVVKTLRVLGKVSIVAALAGAWGIACLVGKVISKDQGFWRQWGDHWLWMLWGAILLIFAARNACIPALSGINVEVVPVQSRSFASGLELTLRNILGYTFGPLLPGLIMDSLGKVLKIDPQAGNDWQLCVGLGFVFTANFLDLFIFQRAIASAKLTLEAEQAAVLEHLREAFKNEDVASLEQLVAKARTVNLQSHKDGAAVVGMANEAIGAHHVQSNRDVPALGLDATTLFSRSKIALASREELIKRVSDLDLEAGRLRAENERLHLLLAQCSDGSITGVGAEETVSGQDAGSTPSDAHDL